MLHKQKPKGFSESNKHCENTAGIPLESAGAGTSRGRGGELKLGRPGRGPRQAPGLRPD